MPRVLCVGKGAMLGNSGSGRFVHDIKTAGAAICLRCEAAKSDLDWRLLW
jgi:hypothetical protein